MMVRRVLTAPLLTGNTAVEGLGKGAANDAGYIV